MAVTPNTDSAFLREVDEELRRDELLRAWRRYGLAAIAAVVAGLLAFGGWLVWQNHRQSAAGAEGEALGKAFDDIGAGRAAPADAELTRLRQSGVPGYRALARITQADLLLQKQDLKGAATLFAEVANDHAVGQPLRDLALVRQTAAEFDTLKPEATVARLRGLALAGNPWFASAGEMVAVSYLREGRRDLAGQLYAQIARAENVPPSLRDRAVQMAGVLGGGAAPPAPTFEDNKAK